MKTIKAIYEDGVLRPVDRLDLPEDCEVEVDIRISADCSGKPALDEAVRLFTSDETSLGKAAQVAGMDRWSFMDVLRERGIPIEIQAAPVDELEQAVSEIHDLRNT